MFGRTWLGVGVLLVSTVAACGSSDDTGGADEAATQWAVEDIAAEVGIADVARMQGETCVADVDDDGFRDLLASFHHKDPWVLYLGSEDGTFEPSEHFVVETRDRHGCAIEDFNGDGLLDMYISLGACAGECQNSKELWIQQPDGSFVDEAKPWGIDDPGGRGRLPVAFNLNGDDLPDLFTGQLTGVKHPSLNRVWVNRGDHFELQEGPATNELGSHCAAAADIDGDGLDDLAVCTPSDGFIIYRNEEGKLVDATLDVGVEPYGRVHAEFADMDADGQPDLVTVTRKRVEILRNDRGRFEEIYWRVDVEDGKDVAIADLDGDGSLDLYIQQSDETTEPDQILLQVPGARPTGRFEPGPEVPSVKPRGGDAVTPIPDWMESGRAALIVNEGLPEDPGPRRLLLLVER